MGIRNYMTDLLTQNTLSVPSQYDTTIVAELGQILNIYQSWIDTKKKTEIVEELNDEPFDDLNVDLEKDVVYEEELLFVDKKQNDFPTLNDDKSDFYSRLLDEVQQKAMNDCDYYDADSKGMHNPKDLVMDYIGVSATKQEENEQVDDEKYEEKQSENEKVNNVDLDDEVLYDYEYSDESEDDIVVENKNENKECVVKQASCDESTVKDDAENVHDDQDDLLMDSVILSHGHLQCDRAYISPSTEDEDELYQYDEESENAVIDQGSPIFSRINSPPPRHRNKLRKEVDNLYLDDNEPKKNKDLLLEENDNIQKNYYNARYPPRRGRYGRNMDVGNAGFYRPRMPLIKKKMEWKRKEMVRSESCVNKQE